jgi:hypothetical protein
MKNAVIAIVFFLCGAAAFTQADLQPLATIKLAKNEVITVGQLKSRVAMYEKQNGVTFPVERRKEILDSLIDEKLVLQAAQKAGLSITDSQVNEVFIQNIRNGTGLSVNEQEFAAVIKQNTGKSLDEYLKDQTGMNVAEYKGFLKNQLLIQMYLAREKQSELSKIPPTDEEIRAWYALNENAVVRPATLKLFLVIAAKGNDSAGARKKIDAVQGEIKSKKNYDEVAKRNQEGLQAGDLYVTRTMQDAQQLRINLDALLKMFDQNTGFVSEPLDTGSNWQFYVIRDKYDAKMLKLDDVYQPGSTTTVYEYIRAMLAQQKQTKFLIDASEEVAKKLRTSQNFTMNKTGSQLDTLLAW